MSDQPAWVKVALGAGVGFLCGVLLIVVLAVTRGGDGAERTPTPTTTVVGRALPDVVGLRLDVARERLEQDGFTVEPSGGGVLGIVIEANWEVREQEPAAGTDVRRGARVELFVTRP